MILAQMDSQIQLKYGWNLQAAPRVEAFIREDVDEIYWGATVHAKANYNSSHGKGDFIEGLWKLDALELFVRDLDSSFYQEFNLSPTGAYWSAVFRDARVPADRHEREFKEIDINSKHDDISWTVSMRVSKSQLGIDSSNLLINMTAVLNTIAEPCYLSKLPVVSEKPDFHAVVFA